MNSRFSTTRTAVAAATARRSKSNGCRPKKKGSIIPAMSDGWLDDSNSSPYFGAANQMMVNSVDDEKKKNKNTVFFCL